MEACGPFPKLGLSAGAPLGLLISYIWWSRGHFDPLVIFPGFLVSISMFRCRLFEAKLGEFEHGIEEFLGHDMPLSAGHGEARR